MVKKPSGHIFTTKKLDMVIAHCANKGWEVFNDGLVAKYWILDENGSMGRDMNAYTPEQFLLKLNESQICNWNHLPIYEYNQD